MLGQKLIGVCLHGSMAFGCFRWACSDIDFLVLVEKTLDQQEKESLLRILLRMDKHAPSKGFEMNVVLRSACSPFADSTPYELYYSNAYRTIQDGKRICAVPADRYLCSVWQDVCCAAEGKALNRFVRDVLHRICSSRFF